MRNPIAENLMAAQEGLRRTSDMLSDSIHESFGRPGPPPHIEVASDREAMKMALQEFIVREMFEHEAKYAVILVQLIGECINGAVKEYQEAPINKGKEPFR